MKFYLSSILFLALAALSAEAAQGISEAAARTIASQKVAGKVLEVEKETHKGVAVFSVEIQGSDGIHEVIIDVVSGKIIEDINEGPTDD